MLDFIQFSLTFCSFFTVLGVIKLRITQPKLARPYRAWVYPVTPLVFLAVMLWMMYYLVVNRPLQSLAGFAMMLSGLAIYGVSLQLSKVASSDSFPNRRFPDHRMNRNALKVRKMKFAALLVTLLAWSIAPAASAETATPDDTARFLAGLSSLPGFAARGADQGCGLAAARELFQFDLRAAGKQPPREGPRVLPRRGWARRTTRCSTCSAGRTPCTPLAFFPSASNYVMSGLEPAGDIPPLTSLPRGTVQRTLRNLETEMSSLLSISFFITKQMHSQLNTGTGLRNLAGHLRVPGALGQDHP